MKQNIGKHVNHPLVWPSAIVMGAVVLGCGGGGAGVATFSALANLTFTPGSAFSGNSAAFTGGTSKVSVGSGQTVLTLVDKEGQPGQRTFTITIPSETIFEGQVFEVGRDGVEAEYTEGPITRGGGPWLGASGLIRFTKKGSFLAANFFDPNKPLVLQETNGPTGSSTGVSGDGGTYNTFPVGVNMVSPSNGAQSNATLGASDPGESVFTGGGTSEYTVTFYVGNQANATKRVIVHFSPSTTIFSPNGSAPPLESIRYEQDTGTGTYVWEGTAGQVAYQPGTTSTISINNVHFSPLSGGASGTFDLSGVLQY